MGADCREKLAYRRRDPWFLLPWSEYRPWRKYRRTIKESRRRSAPWRWRAPGDPSRRRLELLSDVRNSLSHLEFLNEAEIQGLIEEWQDPTSGPVLDDKDAL